MIYLGVLICLDALMNIVLEQVEEIINGEKKHEFEEVFLRGNNGKMSDHL